MYETSDQLTLAINLFAMGCKNPTPDSRKVFLASSGLTLKMAEYVGRQYFILPFVSTHLAASTAKYPAFNAIAYHRT